MCEFNSVNNLPKEIFDFFLAQVMFLDVLVQLPSFRDLHYDEDIIGSVQHFIELDDVGVVDEFQYFDLSFNLDGFRGTLDIILTFLIFSLLMILTATGRLVRSCLASGVAEMDTFNLGKTTLS